MINKELINESLVEVLIMKIPFLSFDKKNEEIDMIDLDKIEPNPYQPRSDFNEEDIKELAESIDNFGLIQPLTVRPRGDKYELIAGERRLRAAKLINMGKAPCIINDFSDEEIAEIALVENLQRKDLDFIEEAVGYSRLLQEFNLTQKELAEKLGKNQSTIANKLRILKLPTSVLQEIKSSYISERHARALLTIEDEEQQHKIVEKIKAGELTVRETEKLIKKMTAENTGRKRKIKTVFKDLKIFTNTLNETIREMEDAGLKVKVDKKEEDEYIEYKIRLPRK